MRDYAKELLDKGLLSRADYDRLLAARSRDEREINRRLFDASKRTDERRRQTVNGPGDGGKAWQAELEAWFAAN